MWFTDNFHIIEKSCAAALHSFNRNMSIFPYSQMLEICREICRNGIFPDEEKTIKLLLKKSIPTGGIEILQTAANVTLIHLIAENIEKNEDLLINAIKSLISLPNIDFGRILYETSETQKLLCSEEAGIYQSMNEETQYLYRLAIYKKALEDAKTEKETVTDLLEKAKKENKHIGFLLDIYKDRRSLGKLLLLLQALIPLTASVIIGFASDAFYLPFLIFLPLLEAMKFITDVIFSLIPPSPPLPQMDFSAGIPEEAKTVIAVSTILPSAGSIKEFTAGIEKLCLSNCRDSSFICILADKKSSPSPTSDSDTADIKAAKKAVDLLNGRYDGKIILAVRKRIFSETENEYTGYERKRGAIIALAELIAEGKNGFEVLYGDREKLIGTKYIMALDSDTKMPLGSLREIVGAAYHPLNRPVISQSAQRVTSGYGIISPRIETDSISANRTCFSSVFAGSGGLPSYSNTVREQNMDLFSESIFSGKGLIDVKAFNTLIPHRFPEQRILSHDILEGIALRTAFLGNVTLTDSFPSNEVSYFRRLHRWIRGDVQNIPFIFEKTTPLPGKFWLIDNIRRSITPVISVLCLILSVFMPEPTALILGLSAVLSAAFPHIFSFITTLIGGGISLFSRLYFSDAMPASGACLAKAFVSVITLVSNAVCSIDAVTRSLFRMTVSKKHLLQWTTAASADSSTAAAAIKTSLPSVIIGIFLIAKGIPFVKFAGLLIFSDLIFAVLSAKKKIHREPKINKSERDAVLSYCASMWKFYEKHSDKKNNFLIPDNVQETPVYNEACRTSPTNIGMMLCSFLAARDFDFIDTDELFSMLEKSFDTIERMEKYKGHLYNWYDTQTLEIMNPRFISTVDSGNFLCCIAALASGLEEYAGENNSLLMIIEKCNNILNGCDMMFLYDKHRKLFRIGYDTQKNEFTGSYFDLLMSEARMTSYFAAASGKVPAAHWNALGRTLSKNGRYTGPVSWSGTMFEYFMPAIFIPSVKNTLGYEALRFCIHCQKKRVKKMNIPYGISESGYYAFDSLLNYSYKAHGVKSLAMRTETENETVISPYSTFLTLPFDPHSAVKNLKRLEKLGMYGKFGFYEAVDFTHSRTQSQPYSVVRSYMAHHIGMSFLACANAVFDNVMQKRFMKNPLTAGGESLLDERIPSDVRVTGSDKTAPLHEKNERIRKISAEYDFCSPISAESHNLSNGEWSLFATDSGQNFSVYGGIGIFSKRNSPLTEPEGIFAAVKEQNNRILPFTVLPSGRKDDNLSASFSKNSIVYKNNDKNFAISQTVCVHSYLPSQIHRFSVRNKTKEKKDAELLIYCEPWLESINDTVSHPAFSKLFLKTEQNTDEKTVTVTRKQHKKENSIFVSFGFADKSDFEFFDDREAVLPRDGGISKVFTGGTPEHSVSADKCVFIKLRLTVEAKSAVNKTLILCAASDKNESINIIAKIRKQGVPSVSKCAFPLSDRTSITGVYAKKIIEREFFGKPFSDESLTAVKNNTLSRSDLWKMSVSGDFPVILVNTEKKDTTVLQPFISLYQKLRLAGIMTELVILTRKGGYDDGIEAEIRRLCRGSIEDAIGKRGGIFILNKNSLSKDEPTLLSACAAAVYPEKNETRGDRKLFPVPILQSEKIRKTENSFSGGGYVIGKKPYLPWCHIIANKNFGTLVSDCSLGFTWAVNSRENKLTPWKNNTRASLGGEMLLLEAKGKRYDIIDGGTAFFKEGSASYLSVTDCFAVKTEVTVQGLNMCKNLSVQIKNTADEEKELSLIYFVTPVLGDNEKNSRFIKFAVRNGKCFAHNPYDTAYRGFMSVSGDEKCDFEFDKTAFLCASEPDRQINDCIIAKRKIILPPKNECSVKFYLSYAQELASASEMPYIIPKKTNSNKIVIETHDKNLDNLFNGFLLNQILSGRIYGRTGFYQCSGAFGFRDQLQDAMAVVLTHPEILRTHIFRCAAAQFKEGDVLHWFHQYTVGNRRIMRGVRTRYSDDLLWLPLAVSEYCLKTGDTSVLSAVIPFIDAPVLENGEKERFGEYTKGKTKDTLYNHCLRAINHACTFGAHSLPLIKGGDWNDSFNAVGAQGKGESVWLAMFLCFTAKKFTAVALLNRDRKNADKLSRLTKNLITAIDTHAWDNDRYLRCFYDDGTPMGKSGNKQCEIDLLPQAWSAIIGMPDKDRVKTALGTADKLLCDRENRIIKLFTPPFTENGKTAGYVNRYPEGIRENGGQYTHGAIWLADAYFSSGDGNKGYEMLKILNPAEKVTEVYRTEPYYLAGDVYSGKGLEGRGGWSIYTGSAGWYYRTVYEKMLGITQTGGLIITNPCLPDGFENSKVKITLDGNTREFIIN